MKRILVIEDDTQLGKSLTEYLRGIDYTVVWARTGAEAFRLYNAENIDLCIIDIGLPDRDGFDVLKDIRQIDKIVPVIFLTARDQINDKITAYDLGADDYICKPFLIKELELRIEAIRKRYLGNDQLENKAPATFQVGEYVFDMHRRILSTNDKQIKLSHIDCELLKLLCINQHSFLKKEIILKAIWDKADPVTARRLSVYMARMRNYLKEDASIRIENMYGLGYKLQCNTMPVANTKG
ncbi:MAG: response regulator transcription factor [Bacteroidia bacterium]|jgi:DNA-binding response OmpR family regulator